MAKTNRTVVFLRIAAVVLLAALLLSVISDLVFYIAREITYHQILNSIEIMMKHFSGKALSNFLYEMSQLLFGFIGAVLLLIVVIMLFSAKDRKAGVVLIIYAAVKLVDNVVYTIVLFTRVSPGTINIKSNLLNIAEYLGIFILLLLLGLLLIGSFKKATAVMGFVLVGLFGVAWLIANINLAQSTAQFVRGIKAEKFTVISRTCNVAYMLSAVLSYIGYMLCSLGEALKPRKNAEIAQDNKASS